MPSNDTEELEEAVLEMLDDGRLSFEELECELVEADGSLERIAFEAPLERGYGATEEPQHRLEDAVRNLLHSQRVAETADWKLYRTESRG